jgi:hypothetical protein
MPKPHHFAPLSEVWPRRWARLALYWIVREVVSQRSPLNKLTMPVTETRAKSVRVISSRSLRRSIISGAMFDSGRPSRAS